MNILEQKFTSTKYKLLKYWHRFPEIESGYIRPIHLELSLTNKCNLNCSFCSVRDRDKTWEMSLKNIKKTIDDFADLDIQAISLTGGGEVSFHPHINEVMRYITEKKEIPLGMISNGTVLNENVEIENLAKLDWLRISLNSLEDEKYDELPLEVPADLDIGFSYVITEDNFDKEMLEVLESYLKAYGARYLRLVPDCNSTTTIHNCKTLIPPMLEGRDERIFFQSKSYDRPKVCWWGYVKPFVTEDNVYMCSANPLIDRKFSDAHKMGTIYEIKEIWEKPKPFETTPCGLCFYKDQNEILDAIILPSEHEKFI